MANAGFVEPEVEAVEFTMHYADVDDWWVARTLMSTRMGDADARWTSPPAATFSPIWSGRTVPAARRQPDHPRPHVGRAATA